MRFHFRQVVKWSVILVPILCINLLIWRAFPPNSDRRNGGRHGVAVGPNLQESESFVRYQRSAKSVQIHLDTGQSSRAGGGSLAGHSDVKTPARAVQETQLGDVYISVKTTRRNHKSRLRLLLDTWIAFAKSQTYIFTDATDQDLVEELPAGHVIHTNCSSAHSRQALCCKMSHEYDLYMSLNKRWFCHVDDDTYVNIPQLLRLLRRYNHTSDWYLGKPSLKRPIEVVDRVQPGQKIAFWFATGGAGFCISQALALKMMPYAGGGRLMTAGEQIRLPDDCTVGYIICNLLRQELTVIETFHSHLEPLWQLSVDELTDQITFSYVHYGDHSNLVKISGFPESVDPTRLLSIHCHLFPSLPQCHGRGR